VQKILLSYNDLEELGFGSRTTIWRKLRDKSLEFPQPIDTGYGQKKWCSSDIQNWIKQRLAASRMEG
jgi:predicted DNA-binding transcriptional regulator AlpA